MVYEILVVFIRCGASTKNQIYQIGANIFWLQNKTLSSAMSLINQSILQTFSFGKAPSDTAVKMGVLQVNSSIATDS